MSPAEALDRHRRIEQRVHGRRRCRKSPLVQVVQQICSTGRRVCWRNALEEGAHGADAKRAALPHARRRPARSPREHFASPRVQHQQIAARRRRGQMLDVVGAVRRLPDSDARLHPHGRERRDVRSVPVVFGRPGEHDEGEDARVVANWNALPGWIGKCRQTTQQRTGPVRGTINSVAENAVCCSTFISCMRNSVTCAPFRT